MADVPAAQPLLLSSPTEGPPRSKSPRLLVSVGRWGIKVLMWVILLAWLGLIFFLPTDSAWRRFGVLVRDRRNCFRLDGQRVPSHERPILVVALLAYIYVVSFSEEHHHHTQLSIFSSKVAISMNRRAPRFPRLKLWTFPVLLDGPFGVVSAAELIGIVLFTAYVLSGISAYTMKISSLEKKESSFILELLGLGMAFIGMCCTSFLFLPVARGSILLRLIDIPFEHATRYHVWLGNLTMMLFTLHGVGFIASWALQGVLLDKLLEWRSVGVANLAGVISLLAGLLMSVTSLHPVRKRYFELFFYTHQLYFVFVIFLAMHVGDFIFIDRFLRFCQSRATVNLISASCLPVGLWSLKYNALSFIFLQVRELSWLQWHPFSVSSSPLDGKTHLAVLVKVLGGWTEKLRGSSSFKVSRITASVEGPYGHEVAYHLMYENLILVAGGIGISPFLAVLSDILHRVEQKRPCLPKNILIIWAVKSSRELSLLSVVDSQNICPSFSSKLNLDIQAYVTQESQPSLGHENGLFLSSGHVQWRPDVELGRHREYFWAGAYYAASLAGFIVSFALLQKFYTIPFGVTAWWYKGFLFLTCMVASVIVFGGLVILLWRHFERENSSHEEGAESEEDFDFRENISRRWLICSTPSRGRWACRRGRSCVWPIWASNECRERVQEADNLGQWDQPIFHFHSHSFDL
ncbi:unnamed protein product [Spirodela intermedia]|uniref:FAD-binding FR-type domain-containing protein n=1 Tax=Spirodela intermedia TaxID=51605 RepID=A0A7I8IQP3_SPIIN|nr:unnamed protein product [Spirodela intermedia]CAA6660249.1 unnamed protein product [Spirodela intermedia]